MRRTSGFSLIEIAIVLAIISLIAAAVLMTGGTLFGRAGTASLLTDIRDLATASRDFKVRYSYFPGDLPNAGTYITGNGGISSGCNYAYVGGGTVGDGLVNTAAESDCALEHLVKAGVVGKVDHDGARYVISKPDVGPDVSVSLWFDAAVNVNAVRVSNLPCEVALEVDRKVDSGTPGNATPFSEGSVRARDASNTSISLCVAGSANDPVPTLLINY